MTGLSCPRYPCPQRPPLVPSAPWPATLSPLCLPHIPSLLHSWALAPQAPHSATWPDPGPASASASFPPCLWPQECGFQGVSPPPFPLFRLTFRGLLELAPVVIVRSEGVSGKETQTQASCWIGQWLGRGRRGAQRGQGCSSVLSPQELLPGPSGPGPPSRAPAISTCPSSLGRSLPICERKRWPCGHSLSGVCRTCL